MKLRKVVLQLNPEDVLRSMRIMMDQDNDEALTVLKDVIKPQVDDATRNHRVPVFEVNYKPHQADRFMWLRCRRCLFGF
jgi:hypothetical protein